MAINPKKHVVPHKHIIGDIVDGVTSNFTGGLIGGIGGGGGWNGGLLNISSGHLPLDPIELINYTWEWVNGKWTPHTKHMPTGDSYLKISDSKIGQATDVFLILVDSYPSLPVDSFDRYGPILGVSTGLMVKKDISCGGFVGANQGIIALGSCLQDSFDPPGAWMLHSECKRINFKGTSFPANPREGWRVIRTDELLGTLGAVDPVYSYQIYERQGSSWVKVGGSSFDNGYEFGVSRPNWGDDRKGEYFITTGPSNNGHIHQFNGGSSWTDKGDIDDPAYSGFFDTFEIRRAYYKPPLQTTDYAHLRCANITAHNTNPAADLTYGLGTPDRRWLGICADTVYADHIKDLKGEDFDFGVEWDGGTVHDNITILRPEPQLRLNATSGNPAVVFYNESVPKLYLAYSAANNHLYIQDPAASDPTLIFRPQGTLSIASDFYTAGKIILRSTIPIIDFAPPGLPTGQEYQVRLEGTTQNNAGWLNLYGHLKIAGDTRIEHAGDVYLNLNSTDRRNPGVNFMWNGNTEGAIVLAGASFNPPFPYLFIYSSAIILSAPSGFDLRAPLMLDSSYGTAGQVLTTNGPNNMPSWQTPGAGSGGWNGGVVTGDNITVQRIESQLRLNATSGSPALVFYRNGEQRLGLIYSSTESILSFWDYSGNRQIARLDHGGNYSILGDLTLGPAGRIRLNDNLGNPGQVLISNGNSPPTWQTLSGGGGGGWNGGTVTENIAVLRADPQLHLNATSGGPAIFFYNASAVKMSLRYSTAGYFYLQDDSGGRLIARWDHSGDYGVLGSFTAGTTSQYIRIGATSSNCYIETSAGRALYLQPASGNAVYATTDFYANNILPRYSNSGDLGNGSTRWNGAVINNIYSTSVFPLSSNSGSVGNSGTYWNQIYGNTIRWRSGSTFACTPEESGKDWPHAFSDYMTAAERLTHESTKTKYHVVYAPKSPKEVVCICGKVGFDPCEEHRVEWEDRYTVSIDNMVYAAGYMTLEHAANIAGLIQHNLDLEERLVLMEKKLERLLLLATATPAD
ncbi:MAG: hypothetical protein LBH79_03190 [Nitrososphaerota archaeon]|jgi:hypothetical protein|nr:hypothetical protein [Nitrososphaerota archaeon]